MNKLISLICKYGLFVKIILVILVISYIAILNYNYKEYYKKLLISNNNNIALKSQNDSIINTNILFQYTIDELKSSNDSINKELVNTIKRLKLKEREIKSLSYLSSNITKTDTIIYRDTIFQPHVNIDTTIKDNWYSLNVQLDYPNNIVVSPTFKSEKVIIAKEKKVWLVKPKWWICRLFKKKNTIIEVEVLDNNPYITNKEHKHIEIIK